MKKYKLQDLVANGSHSRLKVDSDLLVGDIENGYGYGDILDANATKGIVTNVADDKVNAAKEELIQMIEDMSGGSAQDYAEILRLIEEIQAKNNVQDSRDQELAQYITNVTEQVQKVQPTVGGDNDNLIFDFD